MSWTRLSEKMPPPGEVVVWLDRDDFLSTQAWDGKSDFFEYYICWRPKQPCPQCGLYAAKELLIEDPNPGTARLQACIVCAHVSLERGGFCPGQRPMKVVLRPDLDVDHLPDVDSISNQEKRDINLNQDS